MSHVKAFLVSDGAGGKIVGVACDNPKDEAFQIASKAAQFALGFFGVAQLPLQIVQGSFGTRKHVVPEEMLSALLAADAQNMQRHCFDVALVTAGPLKGLRAVGIGSNTEKRERACKVALVVAAVKGPLPSGGTRPGDGSRSMRSLIDSIDFSSSFYETPQEDLAAEETVEFDEVSQNHFAANSSEVGQPSIDERPNLPAPHPPMNVQIDEASNYEIKKVLVDDVSFTQENCGRKFKDGRSLEQLVAELHAGKHDPLRSEFLYLEALWKRDRNGTHRLYSNDNRRLWCLKEFQSQSGKHVYMRIRLIKLPIEAQRLVDRFDPVYDNQYIRIRGR